MCDDSPLYRLGAYCGWRLEFPKKMHRNKAAFPRGVFQRFQSEEKLQEEKEGEQSLYALRNTHSEIGLPICASSHKTA